MAGKEGFVKGLSNIGYLQVTENGSNKVYCGSNQEWFMTEHQRLTGCGPSVAANILFYLGKKKIKNFYGGSKYDLLKVMEEAWRYVTPAENGIPSTDIFCTKLKRYLDVQGGSYEFFVLNIPPDKSGRPTLHEVIQFIVRGLQEDTPIAFLNLDNGEEQDLEPWHWVTIAVVYFSEREDTAWIDICDEGIVKRIDLKLWLETTVQGGGLVYLLRA